MSQQTQTPNVKLTLTCGNSKCRHVISQHIVVITAAPRLKHAMASQQLQCPKCGKVGRNTVTDEQTYEPLTGGAQVETADGTVDVALRSHKPVAPNKPRRDRGNPNRGNYTPVERGTRRRRTRAAGKTAVPPMSERQRRKLERRGQADQLVAKSRETNEGPLGPQVPTPQAKKASRAPAPPTTPRSRSHDARKAAKAAADELAAKAAAERMAAEAPQPAPVVPASALPQPAPVAPAPVQPVLEQPAAPQPPEPLAPLPAQPEPPVAPAPGNPDTPSS